MERNYDLEKRKYVIGGAVIVIVLIFLIRLLSLQIMSEDYKKMLTATLSQKIQYPSRGVIYDRNEKLLVYNQAAYDITVIMKEITELDTMDLCQTLKISPEFLRKNSVT